MGGARLSCAVRVQGSQIAGRPNRVALVDAATLAKTAQHSLARSRSGEELAIR